MHSNRQDTIIMHVNASVNHILTKPMAQGESGVNEVLMDHNRQERTTASNKRVHSKSILNMHAHSSVSFIFLYITHLISIFWYPHCYYCLYCLFLILLNFGQTRPLCMILRCMMLEVSEVWR